MTMTVIHGKRLLKLADKLETVPRKEFDMNNWWNYEYNEATNANRCLTSGCAMGWAGTMPDFKRLGLRTDKENGHVWIKPKTQVDQETYDSLHDCYKTPLGVEGFEAAQVLFGLGQYDAIDLFGADSSTPQTPKTVARNIRRLVKSYHPELLQSKGK